MHSPRLVSIVLPTYNGEKYIRETIESCLRQTHTLFELIVIDDCSSDATSAIVQEYATIDKRIIYRKNTVNLKLPASLNAGFALAKGDYHTWISDDNIFADDAIGTMACELDNNPATDLVYSSYTFINDKGKALDQYGEAVEALIFTCAIGACFLYKKEIHDRLKGYDGSKFRMEDYDFWLRAARYFRFTKIDCPGLYFYRKHNESLTSFIYTNSHALYQYRKDYCRTMQEFFDGIEGVHFSAEDTDNHVSVFFNEIVQQRNYTADSYERLQVLQRHFDKLRNIPWEKTLFDADRMRQLINRKEKELLYSLAGTLLFENLQLKGKNPRLAGAMGKPVFWYYKEYEVLPSWYKKIGHIIKIIQGNKTIPSSNKSDS